MQELAKKAAELTGQHERAIFDVLLERERLGTTGVGHGIAIPHGKLANLDRVHGVFARLERPVDFDAIDDQPVDLMFLLLAPEAAGADHLKALAGVPSAARRNDVRQAARLRQCGSHLCAADPGRGESRRLNRRRHPLPTKTRRPAAPF